MKKKRPRILITNDDGIEAPGLFSLASRLAPLADVTVVAPSTEQSATSLSITVRSPLRLEKVDWKEEMLPSAWRVNGTPADCVKLALNIVLETPPDLILSGINRGDNSGRNLLYSGTIAGVIEGVLHNIPGIAFSVTNPKEPRYETAAVHIPSIVQFALDHPLPQGTLLNVNIPSHASGGIQGFRFTRQGKGFFKESLEERLTPHEEERYYWLGAKIARFEEDLESDVYWLERGFLTATPIHISELTDRALLSTKKELFEQLFIKRPQTR